MQGEGSKGKIRQAKTRKDKQDKARHGKTRKKMKGNQENPRHGNTREHKARKGKTRQGKTRKDKTRKVNIRHERKGKARHSSLTTKMNQKIQEYHNNHKMKTKFHSFINIKYFFNYSFYNFFQWKVKARQDKSSKKRKGKSWKGKLR
jgi:hypothetical protein